MKKIILFLALLLISCSGLKKTTKTDVTQKLQTNTKVSKDTEEKEKGLVVDKSQLKTDSSGMKALELIEKLTQDFNARLKIYDTDKPIDPVTGTPPLASELEISNKNTSDRKQSGTEQSAVKTDQKNDIKIDWSKVIEQKIDSAMKANEKLIAKTDNQEKPVNKSWWIWLIVGMAIPVGLWILWKLK